MYRCNIVAAADDIDPEQIFEMGDKVIVNCDRHLVSNIGNAGVFM